MTEHWKNRVHFGDCLDVMQSIPDNSVDLIVTSPPYADARKHTYGGVHPDEYVDWFVERAVEMRVTNRSKWKSLLGYVLVCLQAVGLAALIMLAGFGILYLLDWSQCP